MLQYGPYKKQHDKYHPFFQYYLDKYGYFDIFLMCPDEGDTYYTVTKEPDFGTIATNIDSELSSAWKTAVKGNVALTDMKAYAPSNGAPAMFVAAPVKEKGQVVGVLAFQISLDAINNIMQERTGMGESGESYLVGNDKLMRSDSFLDPKNHSVEASFKNPSSGSVDTEAVEEIFKGNSESRIIIDYNGNPVLSVFSPL